MIVFAQHVLVHDPAAVSSSAPMDEEEMPAVGRLNDGSAATSRYWVGQRTDSWTHRRGADSLDAEHHG